jgi:hypothetical protein
MVARSTFLPIPVRLGNLGKVLGIGLQYQSLTTALRWWQLFMAVTFTYPQIVERVGLRLALAASGTQFLAMLHVQNLP